MTPALLLVFVKPPRPGLVKTRLAVDVGAQDAAELYRALADRIRHDTEPRSAAYRRVFFFTPTEAEAEVRDWLGSETCVPQADGDLGERLQAAFEWGFARGARRVVIVGSDVLGLTRDTVSAALAALDHHDLVLGPAHDGGYTLIGLRRSCPALFRDIPWSTASVLQQTLDRAAAEGLRVAQLAPLSDIDTVGDLRREWADIAPWLPADLVSRLGPLLAPPRG